MKILIIGFVFSGVFLLSNISVCQERGEKRAKEDGSKKKSYEDDNELASPGPMFPEPNGTFMYFKFDEVNRGSWNLSHCVSELLTCWEIVRGDIICSYEKYTESICGNVKNDCHEYYGKLDNSWYEYTLFEAYCKTEGFQEWTK